MKKIFSFFAAALFAGSMMAGNVFTTDFASNQGEWTIENKSNPDNLDHIWAHDSQYGCMKASAYVDGANHATESWLISPAIDLSGVTASKLVFAQARKYGDNSQLSVKAKAGDGEWAALTVSAWPTGADWSFVDAEADLAALAGKANVQIAFVYTSTTSGGPTWEVKNVVVTDGGAVDPVGPVSDADVIFLPADFAGQGTAATLETPGSAVSTTKDGVTVATDNGYGHNLALRVYKGGQFSITSASQVISKIKFQFYDTYTGGLETEITVGAKEWKVDEMASQARVEKIEIYFEGAGVEDIVLTQKAQKVMVDGVVYIMRDNKLFNLQGAQVR